MNPICATALVLLLGLGSSYADEFGDVFPNDAAPVPFDISAWCEMAGHHFQFEKTPLADVIRALGAGTVRRTGDPGAANFDYYVDYTDGTHLVRFSSNNDMGGDDHALQDVEIIPLAPKDRAAHLPSIKTPIQFPFGSSDISLPALTRKLGRSAGHHGIFAYTYSTKYQAHDAAGRSWTVDAYAYLEVRVQRGAITAMSVDHTSESE